MMRRLINLMVILLVLASIGASLLLTPTGLKLSLLAAKKIVPGELRYKTADGVLVGPIDITGLTYKSKGENLSIEKLHFQWRALDLLLGRFTVSEFTADHINLSTKKTNESKKKSSSEMPKLDLPLALRIDYLQFNHITIKDLDQQKTIALKSFSIRNLDAQTKLTGKITAILLKPYPVNLSFDLSGNFNQYQFQAKAKNNWIDWHLVGHGTSKDIQWLVKTGKTVGGRFNGNMALQWAPEKHWEVNLTGQQLNLSVLDPRWPNQLSLQLKTKGSFTDDPWPLFYLTAKIITPGNNIQISGQHHKTWNLKWKVDAPALNRFYKAISGALSTTGQVEGPTQSPRVSGQLHAKQLNMAAYQLKDITGQWFVDLANQKNSRLNLNAQNVFLPSLHFNTLNANINHQPKKQKTAVSLRVGSHSYGSNTLHADLYGVESKEGWSGSLDRLNLNSPTFGRWHLSKKSHITVSKTRFKNTPLCLASQAQSICTETFWSKGADWKTELHASQLSFDRLLHLINPTSQTSHSTINLKAEAKGKAEKLNTASVNLHLTPGMLDFDTLHKKKMNFSGANWTLSIKDQQLQTQFNADPSKQEKVRLNLTLPWNNFQPVLNKPITGSLDIQIHNTSFLNALSAPMAIFSGPATGQMTIAGTLQQPKLNGSLGLSSEGIKLPSAQIKLATPKIRFKTNSNTTYGEFRTSIDEKPLTLKGNAKLNFPNQLSGTFSLDGEALRLMNTLEYVTYVTPHLSFSIKDKTVTTHGTIDVPKASLQPESFGGGGASLPSDVVFVTQDETTPTSPWAFLTNVQLRLGDDVKVNTNGISARLTGNVKITKASENQSLVGNGAINIVDGQINTRGHRLAIKSNSMVSFANSPISNPNLDITVIRAIDSITQFGTSAITVGVYVQGTANNPQISFFSYPAHLSQADILSYLILGHSSSANSAADVTTLLQSVDFFHLGGKSSSSLLSEVTQGLGLSEFGVQSGTTLDALGTPVGYDQSSFVVGRYLTRHIYLRYVTDLDYAISVFQLRYIFSPSWLAQTESSTLGNGGDILYTIQRPKDDTEK